MRISVACTLIVMTTVSFSCGAPHRPQLANRWTLQATYVNGGLDCTASGTLTVRRDTTQAVAGSYSLHSSCDGDLTGFDEYGPVTGHFDGSRVTLVGDGARPGADGWVWQRMWSQCRFSGIHYTSPETRIKGALSCDVAIPDGRTQIVDGTFEAIPHVQ